MDTALRTIRLGAAKLVARPVVFNYIMGVKFLFLLFVSVSGIHAKNKLTAELQATENSMNGISAITGLAVIPNDGPSPIQRLISRMRSSTHRAVSVAAVGCVVLIACVFHPDRSFW